MIITFDPAITFDGLMAAFDKAERACSPSVVDIVLDLEIADLFERLGNRGIAVLVANQKAWRESAGVSGIDPRYGWGVMVDVAEIVIDRMGVKA